MTDTSDIPLLHPSLQKVAVAHRRRLRRIGLLIFLIMAGALLLLMVNAFSNRDLGNLLLLALIGLLILPTMILLGALIRHLDRWHGRQLYQAHRTLLENQPLVVRFIPAPAAGRRIAFALPAFAGAPLTIQPFHVRISRLLHWNHSAQSETTVDLYCRKFTPHQDLVALQANGDALIGKVIALEAYYHQRRRRRMMAAAIALLALMPILIVLAKT